jgi:predicted nucleic acid-binding protein
VRVIFADDQTTHHYASVFRQLRKQATPIPTNDMWLAALVLQDNLALHARDKHFDHLPLNEIREEGLGVSQPWLSRPFFA